MKAVTVHQFGLDHPMVLEDLPAPEPGPGQICVVIRAAGVNPLEIAIRQGEHPRAKAMKLPYICGSDVSGEVESVGKGVEGFSPGDRVWGRSISGGYAERGLLPASSTGRLPEGMSFADGSSLPIPLLTAWNALVIKGEAGPGHNVLVQGGAGGVGHLAIQLARQMGCRVLTTVSSKEKGDLCQEAGAEVVINYREEDIVARVMEATGGRGVEVVVETSAFDNLVADTQMVALDGRIVIVGAGTGKKREVTLAIGPAGGRDARILALSSGNLGPKVPDILRRLEPILESGGIRPHIGKELPLDQAEEAHQIVLSGKFLGKVVLTP
jgi:NADPH2:quinone reductase